MDKKYGILIICAVILFLCFVGGASAKTWSVDGSGGADFTGIQDAINNSRDGDTILVHSGVYNEKVVVNKSVTLKGIGYPVVAAGGEEATLCLPTNDVITLTADGITLVGFNATKSSNGWSGRAGNGIEVRSDNNTITGNNVYNNNHGIHLISSSNNTITGNTVSNNWDGFELHNSNNNTITGNSVSNGYDGFELEKSNNNTITGNNVSNNWDGFELERSNNNTITGNNVSNNRYTAINLVVSNNNTITGNNVCNNDDGFELSSSTSNNAIYLNNFINNNNTADYYVSTNIWNSPLEMTYTYDGTTYKSYLGNYWDDYEGTDADGDGIGDTYYSIDSEKDEGDDYPLMTPFENYIELVVGEDFL